MRWVPLIYKNIDFSDFLMISDNGQLYSLKTKKILKQYLNKRTGYYGVCVSLGCREKKKLIKPHIAVAFNFVDGYIDGLVVNHKDGNKRNNKASNLEWVTVSQNRIHAIKNDLSVGNLKIKCMNTGQVFFSVTEACEWCGLSQWSRSIAEYLNGKKGRKSAGKHPITGEPLQWKLV